MVTTSGSVLLVDPEVESAQALATMVGAAGFSVQHVRSGTEALVALAGQPFDAVLTDVRVSDQDGMDLLGEIRRRWSDVAVIVVAAEASVPLAVQVMKAGAFDVLGKPFDADELAFVLGKVVAVAERAQTATGGAPSGAMLGEGRAMRKVDELIARAAPGNATVLIRGESGTGKELVACALHDRSPRASGPFVKIHCAALPDALLESELFGYEKGAFTGAASRKPGRVELAQGGTFFLDEIGDVTQVIQVKLLRLLQDRQFERLGGTEALHADVRFLAATHRDLETMVEKGEFRQDLFYRLNVVPLWLPPLRARREDIALLATSFCRTFAAENHRPGLTLADAAIELLRSQRWPGNVRQLQNLVERLVVLAPGSTISAADVKDELAQHAPFPTQSTGTLGTASSLARGDATSSVGALDVELRDAERRALVKALAKAGGNRTLAAKMLGVSRRTLYYKLEEHGIG